jgi:mannose-1-phosphate guanylyltransferase
VKAIILSGGKGTRGRPYTNHIPKAMIPINDIPLIDHITKYLQSLKIIDEIIIISDFKGIGGQIKNYYIDYKHNKKYHSKKKITLVQDSGSGTGGDILHIENNLKKSNEFLLWFVDNLCAIDITKMLNHFKEKKSIACIATRTKRKEETGFAIVKDGIIKDFKEKPIISMPMSECLGIYILSTDIIKKIKRKKSQQKEINLSYDILQDLSKDGDISAYDIGDKEWLDIESPTILERNKKSVDKIIKQMEE